MVSIADLQKGDTSAIVTSMIVAGLGFYLAIGVSDAVKVTVDKFLPEQDDLVARNWISLVIAVIIVTIVIYIIVTYFKSQLNS